MKYNLREDISAALLTVEERIRSNPNMLDRQKGFIIIGINDAVDNLIKFSELAREGRSLARAELPATTECGEALHYGSNRKTDSIVRAYLASGQAFSSLLFEWGLRDSVYDKIRYTHGVDFNGLRVNDQVKHKTTGDLAFVLFYEPNSRSGTVTLSRDGSVFFTSNSELENDYTFI